MLALPTAATAQTTAPDLRSLHVSSDGGLSPGAELGFTVEGSSRAQTSVRIDGVNRTIALRETSTGIYAGTYTVTRQDTILQSTPIRVTMQSGNRSTVANYTFPVGMASTPSAEPKQQPVERLKINRFTAVPVDSVEPGSELRFSVNGMPGGSAEVEIPGVAKRVALREVRTGVYEGSYTIRKQDKPQASRPLVATLWQGEQSVSTKLAQPWVKAAEPVAAAAAAVVVRNTLPRAGSTITASTSVPVSGTFYDKNGAGVDPKSVRFLVSGRNVTAGSKITPQSFSYRANLKPGRHTVDVTAEDKAGNVVRKSWSFKVVAGKVAATNSASQRCEP